MGRTLHYSITKDSAFTTKEKKILHNHSLEYNSGVYEDIWTCENFFLSPLNYYPNWKTSDWDKINKRIDELEKLGLESYDIVEKMRKEKMVLYHDKEKNSVSGFTKVQGNEFNAALVYIALIELSKKLPKTTISLRDEGEYLLCKVHIRNGKAQPQLSYEREHLENMVCRTVLSTDYSKNILGEITIPDDIHKQLKYDLNIENSYGDCLITYINNTFQKINQVMKKVDPHMKDVMTCIYNIENRWFDPWLFCRKINIEDFVDYKMTPATLMSGFYGEYWNVIPEKDAEFESYNAIGKIQNLLGNQSENLKILGTTE